MTPSSFLTESYLIHHPPSSPMGSKNTLSRKLSIPRSTIRDGSSLCTGSTMALNMSSGLHTQNWLTVRTPISGISLVVMGLNHGSFSPHGFWHNLSTVVFNTSPMWYFHWCWQLIIIIIIYPIFWFCRWEGVRWTYYDYELQLDYVDITSRVSLLNNILLTTAFFFWIQLHLNFSYCVPISWVSLCLVSVSFQVP